MICIRPASRFGTQGGFFAFETYSLACTGEDKGPAHHFRVSLLDQIYWISGSVLGSLAGSWIKFNTAGIAFSLTALLRFLPFPVFTVALHTWKRNTLLSIVTGTVCCMLLVQQVFV